MTGRATRTAIGLLFCFLALPAWGQQYYLYESKPVTAEQKNLSKEGILVTEVPVQKGDTLYDISKKYSGRGMYYPQILLFNSLKNPNLIYPGNTLKVPVTQAEIPSGTVPAKEFTDKSKKKLPISTEKIVKPKTALPVTGQQPAASSQSGTPVTEISLSDLKALDEKQSKKKGVKKKADGQVRAKNTSKINTEKPAITSKVDVGTGSSANSAAGQKLFEKAVKAYRQDDFRGALELFDRYLADNSGSPLAADASLYKAECYLKLSSQ